MMGDSKSVKVNRNKCCFVPGCSNTSVNNPEKVFMSVPQNIKRKNLWFSAVGREHKNVSMKTHFHCCEDHFKLEENMENYWEYRLSKVNIRMKPDVVPHIFTCQPDKKISYPRQSSEKRARKKKIGEILQETVMSSSKSFPENIPNNPDPEPSLSQFCKFRSTTRPSDTEPPLPTNTILFPETAEGSQPSTSSSGSPSTDPFKEEPSCSRDDASALEWLPEQTNPPDLRPRPFKGCKDKIYCRLCLKPANKNSLTPLTVVDFNYPGKSDSFKKKKLEKVEEINKMLKHCLPFYDSLTFNPIICSICFGRLKIAYEFSQECLKNQRLIEKYAETYGTTEKVINLNEMVETQFGLPNDENLSETETKVTDIPKVTRSSTRISGKRRYPTEDGPSVKKQKEYQESHDEDSLASSNEDANIKIEPDDDDSCPLTESVKTEPDEDDSNAFTENITHGEALINPNKIDVDHTTIKVEPTYIDCPDFVKNESVDDLHVESKVFSERTVVKTDIEGQHSQFLGAGNVSPDVIGAPSFARGSVFPSVGSSLEDTTSDVIK